MPRRRRNAAPPRRSATQRNDAYLLDEFLHQDLSTWQRKSGLLHKYRIKQFYELESLRELHRQQLVEALRESGPLRQQLSGWTRIVNYRYSLEPLPARGSLSNGVRFNIGADLDVGQFAPFSALYIASNYDFAYAECFGIADPGVTLKPHELALRGSSSFSSVVLNGDVQALLDLRDVACIKGFAQIIGKFRLNQELQQLARELGMKGPLLLASVRDLHDDLLGSWRGMPSQYGLPANSQLFARYQHKEGRPGDLVDDGQRFEKRVPLCRRENRDCFAYSRRKERLGPAPL